MLPVTPTYHTHHTTFEFLFFWLPDLQSAFSLPRLPTCLQQGKVALFFFFFSATVQTQLAAAGLWVDGMGIVDVDKLALVNI